MKYIKSCLYINLKLHSYYKQNFAYSKLLFSYDKDQSKLLTNKIIKHFRYTPPHHANYPLPLIINLRPYVQTIIITIISSLIFPSPFGHLYNSSYFPRFPSISFFFYKIPINTYFTYTLYDIFSISVLYFDECFLGEDFDRILIKI